MVSWILALTDPVSKLDAASLAVDGFGDRLGIKSPSASQALTPNLNRSREKLYPDASYVLATRNLLCQPSLAPVSPYVSSQHHRTTSFWTSSQCSQDISSQPPLMTSSYILHRSFAVLPGPPYTLLGGPLTTCQGLLSATQNRRQLRGLRPSGNNCWNVDT